ncbi:hypothetical protein GCM10028805_41370 [Spirosoma harenae]
MKKWQKITLLVLGTLIVLSLIYQVRHKAHIAEIDFSEKQQKAALSEASKLNPRRDLVIKTFTWQKAETGSIAYHWFTIYNTSKRHSYKTIPVRFLYYSEAGDEVGRTDKVIDKAVKIADTVHIAKVATALLYEHVDGADMEIIE